MAKAFYIKKQSGTYSETLEAFGVATLLDEIFERNNVKGIQIIIKDLEHSYVVETNKELTEDLISNLTYFQIIKFIKKEANQNIPNGINDYFDYPKQKAIQDEYKERYKQVEKIKSEEEKKKERKRITEEKLSEFGKKIDSEYHVIGEICSKNPYDSYSKLYSIIYENKDEFRDIVKLLLNPFVEQKFGVNKIKIKSTHTAQSLCNPNSGKGLNKPKATGASSSNIDSTWISELLKISGAIGFMNYQLTKVGTKFDSKISVPEFNEITLRDAKNIFFDFRKTLKVKSPIKLDIINTFNFIISFIKNSDNYRGRLKKSIKGFHSVYQKKLGGPTKPGTVVNISYLSTPDFISINNRDEAHQWIEILEHQKALIENIDEQGDAMKGLLIYRNFLGAVEKSSLNYFNNFSFWYSGYLMQKLTKGNRFVRTFNIEELNKFYSYMANKDLKLIEIIQNEGFLAIAQAIRKSTVSLQYTPKDQRKFEIRYGLAQQLQNKSKSKEDLTTFIGEFIGVYNAETARNAEKNSGKALRSNVKDSELLQFYMLLDHCSPRLLGALLSSYGFALNKKDAPKNENEEETLSDEN